MKSAVALAQFCFLWSAILASDARSALVESSVEFPSCGVASVFAACKQVGLDVSVSDVKTSLLQQEGVESLDVLSLTQLRESLESFGLHAKSVRFDAALVNESTPVPAIARIRPRKGQPTAVGHFVLLTKISGDRIRFLDLANSRSSREVSKGAFAQVWNGECIIVSKTSLPLFSAVARWAMMCLLCAGACASLAVFWRVARRRGIAHRAGVLHLAVVVCIVGCEGRSGGVVFETRSRSFGEVRQGKKLVATFQMTNTGDVPVRITGVESSCSCTKIDYGVPGQEVSPGQTQVISVTLNTAGKVGNVEGSVKVLTDCQTSPTVWLSVDARVVTVVRVLQSVPVSVSVPIGASAEFDLSVETIRSPGDNEIHFRSDASSFDGLEVVNVSSTDSIGLQLAGMTAKPLRTSHVWTMRIPKELASTSHTRNIKLVWTGAEDTHVAVRVVVKHPIEVMLSRLYCGNMNVGEVKSIRVPIRLESSISWDDVLYECGLQNIEIRPSEADHELVVVATGTESGPFSGQIVIRSKLLRSVPPLVIPVSGVVR